MVTHSLQFVVLRAELGQSVARAVNYSGKLRNGEEEVDPLRNKEKHQRLGEMSKHSYHCKCHPSKVAESISHKDLTRVCIVFQ